MKSLNFFYSLLLFSFSQFTHATTDADRQKLTYLKEKLWPQAYEQQDAELLDSILDPSFELVSANGQRTSKADELESLVLYPWPHDNFSFTIKRLDIYRNNFAIVSGEGRGNGSNKEGKYCFAYQSSNVLHKVEGEWKALLSHVSGVTSC